MEQPLLSLIPLSFPLVMVNRRIGTVFCRAELRTSKLYRYTALPLPVAAIALSTCHSHHTDVVKLPIARGKCVFPLAIALVLWLFRSSRDTRQGRMRVRFWRERPLSL